MLPTKPSNLESAESKHVPALFANRHNIASHNPDNQCISRDIPQGNSRSVIGTEHDKPKIDGTVPHIKPAVQNVCSFDMDCNYRAASHYGRPRQNSDYIVTLTHVVLHKSGTTQYLAKQYSRKCNPVLDTNMAPSLKKQDRPKILGRSHRRNRDSFCNPSSRPQDRNLGQKPKKFPMRP